MAATDDVVIVHLDGEFKGWHATMRAPSRLSARVIIDVESDSNAKRLSAYRAMILSVEGWKDLDGNPTNDPLEGPVTALAAAAEQWGTTVSELPKE
jgi:hypothetical protein